MFRRKTREIVPFEEHLAKLLEADRKVAHAEEQMRHLGRRQVEDRQTIRHLEAEITLLRDQLEAVRAGSKTIHEVMAFLEARA